METSPRSQRELVEVERVRLVTDSVGDRCPYKKGEGDECCSHDDGGGADLTAVVILFERRAEACRVILPKLAGGGHVVSFLG